MAKSMGAQGAELVKLRAEYDALAASGGLIASADKLAQITELLSKGSPEARAHAVTIGKLREEYDLLAASGNIDEARGKLLEIGRALLGQKSAADLAWEAIRKLEAEHAALVSSGNITGANKKLEEISTALRAMEPAAGTAVKALDDVGKAAKKAADDAKQLQKSQEDAAAAIAAAYKDLGIVTDTSLKEVATRAKASFDLLASSGTASARELALGFEDAAKKAIAANNGIAPSWVAAQAAARGYAVEVDATGKTTVKSMADAKGAVDGVATSHKGAVGAVASHAGAVRDLAAAYSDAAAKALVAQGQFLAAAQAQRNADTGNSSITKTQANTNPVDGVPTFNSREEADGWLKAWKAQYQRDNPFATKRGGQLGNYMHDLTMFEYQKELDSLAMRDAMKKGAGGTTTNMPTPGTTTGTTVNINVEGVRRSINTDSAGADALQDLIRQLTAGKGTYQ